MAPKPFKLETVLKFRKRQENLAQERFVEAQISLTQAIQAMTTVKQSLNLLVETLQDQQKMGIVANDLARFEDRIQFERDLLLRQQKNVAEKQKNVNSRRRKLLEKSREFKVLNTLKEQQNLAWHIYLEKKDSAMLDEIAILRYGRRDH